MNKRIYFLERFLGALGAAEIEWTRIMPDYVQGAVVYDSTDPEERQDFIWQVTEADVPREEVVLLAAMINAQRLLSIDKLTVSRQELQRWYVEYTGLNTVEASFRPSGRAYRAPLNSNIRTTRGGKTHGACNVQRF